MSIQNDIRESGTARNPGARGQGHREENGAMRTQTGFLDSLTSAVRDNPVAAALIGGGALWLLMDNDKLKGAVSSAAAAASPMVDIGARNLRSAASGPRRTAAQPTAPEMDHEGSFRVGETLREAGNAASDTMSGAADKIRDRFDEGVAYARESFGKLGPGKESLTKAQSTLADILERQPLVLGAIGWQSAPQLRVRSGRPTWRTNGSAISATSESRSEHARRSGIAESARSFRYAKG